MPKKYQENQDVDRPLPLKGDDFCSVVSRRSLLKGAAAALPLVVLEPLGKNRGSQAAAQNGPRRLSFEPITLEGSDRITVAANHGVERLIRWGDPLFAGAPEFSLDFHTPEAQAQQFGYNCDFLMYFPLPLGGNDSGHGLLAVNHEYTNPELMFKNYRPGDPFRDHVDIEIMAHGLSIVEVMKSSRLTPGGWTYVQGSPYNRRITGETEMEISGPAAGHPWLRTSYDATGTRVRGTFNNCGGGITPWGTLLTAEENFDQYFANVDQIADADRQGSLRRIGFRPGPSRRRWENFHGRFDLAKEPNEPNRFGFVVEIDPYDPNFTPRKRSALGRFKHEAATVRVAPDGRVTVYSGDDARFEYVYKFVTNGTYDPSDRQANLGLLDDGTLYVARFNDDGTGEWLPLVQGSGPLTAANGFATQADVLLKTRQAADLVGATPMDRPEDVEANPKTGKVYIALTNNTRRTQEQVDAANPRAANRWGHIVELTENNNNPTSSSFTWEIFMLCGNPSIPEHQAFFAGFDPSLSSPIANPDNITFDRLGNLWISTDGQPRAGLVEEAISDGVYAVPTEGGERGWCRQFLSGVPGSEIASLVFNLNGSALFVSIQHPGEGGTFADPISSWPDRQQPVRPSVVVAHKMDGANIAIE